MKNTLKKALSLILAVLMVASVVPFAFAAEECEHTFPGPENVNRKDLSFVCPDCNEEVYCEPADYSAIEVYSYGLDCMFSENIYADEAVAEQIMIYVEERLEEIYEKYPYFGYYTEYEQEEADKAGEEYYKGTYLELDEKLRNGDYGPVLNVAPYVIGYLRVELLWMQSGTDKDAEAFTDEICGEGKFYYLYNILTENIGKMEEIYAGVYDGELELTAELAEEFNKYSIEIGDVWGAAANCIEGIHNYVYETTPATCEKNAIETKTCSFCEKTTVTELENTKLDHVDTEGDGKCDNGGEQLTCEDCLRPVHGDTWVDNLVCWLVMLFNLIRSAF